MNSVDYDKKITDLLLDKKTYNNDLITKWEKLLYISPETAKKLKIRNAVASKMYGLLTVHKNNIPLRPIVSCVQSPFTPLSKYLKQTLSNVSNKNKFYIKGARHFKEKI